MPSVEVQTLVECQTRRRMRSATLTATAVLLALAGPGCRNGNHDADAYGSFEATEVVVSAETAGRILEMTAEEGASVEADQAVGQIDDTQLQLRKKQLEASRVAAAAQRDGIAAQIKVLQSQRANVKRNLDRAEAVLKSGAGTPKQRDDLAGQIDVIDDQIAGVRSKLGPLQGSLDALDAQIAQIDDQIARSTIRNPIAGTILATYAEAGEVAAFGRPLYKVGDLVHMRLRAYVTGEQLAAVKVGSQVTIRFDDGKGGLAQRPGTVASVASSAEFTPKVIQTRAERTNLVYAVRIDVENTDGAIKIGMPGEVDF